ncbi:3-hydroxybutyryl-CoA dehydrogenase [Saccharomonospora viridis]|jgi:3-hydroxybutyryl-CoA dehydrogenase|nr:3-hydroxybutyryl-CoA dehydrogenase [Saccharomonospora viridis]
MGLSKTSASRGCQGVDGSAGSGPETEEAVAAMGVPGSVGVIGGGRMGAGIAQVFATHGAAVSVVESDESAAVAARERIAEGLAKAAERGKLSRQPDVILERVTVLGDLTRLPAEAELVVEAVPERVELKIDVLTRAESVVSDHAVLASNTSSLSITELGAALREPRRFLGMHFFNPVPPSKLVEVVTAPQTDETVTRRVRDWVRALGKTDVVVRDSPGFATSRLGVLLGLEAIRMLEEGVADAEAIDNAMELGYRHPMGPLRSTDLVGLDVRLAIAEYLHSTLGERFAPPRLLRDKVAAGELGRKTGRGFFEWR